MNTVQLLLVAAFLVSAVVAYRQQLVDFCRRFATGGAKPKQSIAVELVGDLLAVTELRDKLAAEGYQEGVDACTVLLRVIVEHNHSINSQAKGAV